MLLLQTYSFLAKKYDLRFVEKNEENDIYDDSSATAFSFDASLLKKKETWNEF